MSRTYKKTNGWAEIDESVMKKAISDVMDAKIPALRAARKHGINANTLRS